MKLLDLVSACQDGFASVAIHSKRSDALEISSGGDDVPGDAQLRVEPAALYATEELALAAWLVEFDRLVKDRGNHSLIWVERPYVECYRITLGDSHGSYRVVRDRYVARGKVVIETYKDSAAAADTTRDAGASAATGGLPTTPTEVPATSPKPKRKAKAA